VGFFWVCGLFGGGFLFCLGVFGVFGGVGVAGVGGGFLWFFFFFWGSFSPF